MFLKIPINILRRTSYLSRKTIYEANTVSILYCHLKTKRYMHQILCNFVNAIIPVIFIETLQKNEICDKSIVL